MMNRLTIGLIFETLLDKYQSAIWEGIIDKIKEADINLICFCGIASRGRNIPINLAGKLLSHIDKNTVDGLIFLGGPFSIFLSEDELQKVFNLFSDLPLVNVGIHRKGLPSLVVDNGSGMKELMVHLIETHGYKKIAFIKGPETNQEAQLRYDIFRRTMDEYKIPINPDFIFNGDFTELASVDVVATILDKLPQRPEVIVAANDDMAIGTINELKKRSIRIPDDLAVVGFDDREDSEFTTPALTTVHQPLFDLGRESVRLLINIIKSKKEIKEVKLPTRVVLRDSCGCSLLRSNKILDINEMFSPKSEAESITRVKQSIKQETLAQFTSSFSRFRNEPHISRLINTMIDVVFKTLKTKKEKEFSLIFQDIIEELVYKRMDLRIVNSIFTSMFLKIKSELDNKDDMLLIMHIMFKAEDIKAKILERIQASRRLSNSYEYIELYRFQQYLLESYDIKNIEKAIRSNLSRLGISTCYIASYMDKHDKDLPSRLLIVSEPQDLTSPANRETTFPASYLLPGKCKKLDKRFSFITYPLFFEKEAIGYLMLEISPTTPIFYENLKYQINNAINSTMLFDKVQHYASILEEEVKEKTKNLKAEINEREEIEKMLSREKERAIVTLESIGDGVITTDTESRIMYLNPVAELLTGWTREEAVGKHLKEVFNVVYKMSHKAVEYTVERVVKENRVIKLSGKIILKNRNGQEFEINESIASIRDENNKILGAVIVIHDKSETQKMSRKLSYQSTHDILTGLYNRFHFEQSVMDMIGSRRQDRQEHILCYIDIDKFKVINENSGYIAGDDLLRQVSQILLSSTRAADIVARIGGDQFGILLPNCPLPKSIEIAEDIIKKINNLHFQWKDKNFKISVSVGIVQIGEKAENFEEILGNANIACNLAKNKGGNRIHLYYQEDAELVQYHTEMNFLPILNKALRDNRFCLYAQPIQPIHINTSGQKEGEHYEILIRMITDDGQILPPNDFLSAAENYNIMPAIDRWVINKLFSSYKNNKGNSHNTDLAKYKYSVNLSGSSLNDDKFMDFIEEQYKRYNIPPSFICFEITETVALSNFSKVIKFITEMKKYGCYFSLDDFGRGWTSFNYLKNLPVDFLKIDGSFVREIVNDPVDFLLVETINHLGHVLGLQTIAEFVETDEIFAKLKEIGVNYAQGYYISKPAPLKI
ncbi:MAG: EAL domain-containing protein [Spirochaetales bacterium]|nr:EAL domain-containing protein [Spirochaetales bacterium]